MSLFDPDDGIPGPPKGGLGPVEPVDRNSLRETRTEEPVDDRPVCPVCGPLDDDDLRRHAVTLADRRSRRR